MSTSTGQELTAATSLVQKRKKMYVFKAVEMPEVLFVEVKGINSSANTTESERIGYRLHIILKDKIRLYFIPTDKIFIWKETYYIFFTRLLVCARINLV